MNEKHFSLLNSIAENDTGLPLDELEPFAIDGFSVISHLWSLNLRFQEKFSRINSVSYQHRYERDADKAIQQYALNGNDWSDLPLITLRVLLERHVQSIQLCVANAQIHNPVMHVPKALSDTAKTKFAVAFLQYRMRLPYPIVDQSALDFDTAFPDISAQLH